ncbi:MAG: hypothetical protein ABI609_15480 [Acidobacteriota bacterium]
MTSGDAPIGSESAPSTGAAEVLLLQGERLLGRINSFNPQQAYFFLHASGTVRRLDFVDISTVSFLKAEPSTSRSSATFPASAQLLTVRFNDGTTLEGIAEAPTGSRRGIFLVPTGDARVERMYVPLAAVREMVSVQRLGEILVDQRMATREMVEEALRRQKEAQAEPLGAILVRQQHVSHAQLQQGLEVQRQRVHGRIGEILIEQGFASRAEIDQALEIQATQRGRRLGTVLIELGYASPKVIGIALALQHNVPFVNLSTVPIDPSLKELISAEFARRWNVVPYSLDLDLLTVAVADPAELDFKPELRQQTGRAVTEVVATPQDLARALAALYGG